MAPRLTLLSALTLLLVLGACAGSSNNYDPGDPRLPNARLEVIGDNTRNLRPGDSLDLQVRYVYDDGSTISGAPIDFEIDGLAAGSRLNTARVNTNDVGIATVRLDAGETETDFRVRATPPMGNSATFTISVTLSDDGRIAVDMIYSGTQPFDQFVPYLFPEGTACDSIDPLFPESLISGSPVTRLSERPVILRIPAGTNYTVAVVARIEGVEAGWGCTPEVEVHRGEETLVDVQLTDLEATVAFEGTYHLCNNFDFAGVLPNGAATALRVLSELYDDENIDGNPATEDWGQDPGAFILDIMMRLTCAWSCMPGDNYDGCGGYGSDHGYGDIAALYQEDFTSWNGAQSRFFGGCGGYELGGRAIQNFINNAVDNYVPTVVTRFLDAASALSRAITEAKIQSVMLLDPTDEFGTIPFEHRLQEMTVDLIDLGGTETRRRFDLREVGLSEITRTGFARAVGDQLVVPAHSFELNFGVLIQYIYVNLLLPLFGFDSTADMLATWIDCRGVAMAIHGAIDGITDRLTEAQYEMYCMQGLDAAGDYVDNNIADFVDVGTTMTISGTARGEDVSTDDLAQTLADGTWTGSWDEAGMSGTVSGSFVGYRESGVTVAPDCFPGASE